MTSQSTSSDLLVCGTCRAEFSNINLFIEHKQTHAFPGGLANELLEVFVDTEAPDSLNSLSDEQSSEPYNLTATVSNQANADHPTISTRITSQSVSNYDEYTPSSVQTIQDYGDSKTLPHLFITNQSRDGASSTKKTNEKKHKCKFDNCDYSSRYLKDVERHRLTHTREKPFKCNRCPRAFNRNDKLQQHIRFHDGNKPFKCKDCSYSTVDNATLKKHMLIHTGERPHVCQICSLELRTSSALTVHLRTHTGDKPFFCNECDARFAISSDLRRHSRIHSGDKPFACNYCTYRARVKSNLLTHIKSLHNNDSYFSCELCDFRGDSKKLLKEHYDKDHGETQEKLEEKTTTSRVKCDHCGYTCANKDSLKVHISRKHGSPKCRRNVSRGGKKRRGLQIGKYNASHKCHLCSAVFVKSDSLRIHCRLHERRNESRSIRTNDASSVRVQPLDLDCSDLSSYLPDQLMENA
ncbi:DgyrCDS5866 [Dimorphilus gyrociliatus]|uniref:DgyrCDS5866 n=1 Tax=Dimorphilus gyrociliatus TaxID=2664684 RepID=A0A7I8VMT8_9ANNE|nr:DgyrCDS5866 [Dimorphilus gyrociliatus]